MQTNISSPFTRRALLSALGGLTMLTGSRGIFAEEKPRATVKIERIKKEYTRILQLWQQERKQFLSSSDTHDYWQGSHGRAIIALGPAILPYLIYQLRKGDLFFNVPLELITGIDISNGNENISEQEKSRLWLIWWGGST